MTIRGRLVAYTLVTTLLHAVIVLVTNSHPFFFGAVGPYTVSSHHTWFYEYATRALHGKIPYRDYPVEYPILALVVFLIPRLFVSDPRYYPFAFGAEMLLFDAAAIYLVVLRVEQAEGIGHVPNRLLWYTLFFASMCPLLIGRYDLAPMALGFAAAHWWFSGRDALGGMTAAAGALLKVFPGVIAAPAFVWEVSRPGRRRGLGTLVFLATLSMGSVSWLALGGRGVLDSLWYHGGRGLQVESLYAGILFLFWKTLGYEVPWVTDHRAMHIAPGWGSWMTPLVLPVQLASILLVAWRFKRSGMADGVRYAGAAILAFIIMGKVLSPQFMVWLFPFMAVLGGDRGARARRTFLLCCIVTTLIYPIGALGLVLNHNLGGILLLNYRNALLIYLLVSVLSEGRNDHANGPENGDV